MSQRKFHLSPSQVEELRHAFHECPEGETRTRYQAVRMYGTNYAFAEIQRLTGCTRARLAVWCKQYTTEGVLRLTDQRTGGNSAKLTAAQRDDIKMRLHQYKPRELFSESAATPSGEFWTVEDLQRAVQQWYGVAYQSRQSYQRLLHESGFSYQRPAKVFKSQRPQQIAEFEEQVEKNSWMSFKPHRRP
jgi:transposase